MIEVSNVRLPLDAGLPGGERIAKSALANALGVKVGDIVEFSLLKRSVDARKRNDIGFVASVFALAAFLFTYLWLIRRIRENAESGRENSL